MSAPLIRINQTGQPAGTPGQSRDDLVIGAELQVTDTANFSGSWVWTVVVPPNSSAVPTGLTTNDVRITPDVSGTYLFYVTFNGIQSSFTLLADGDKTSAQGGAAVKDPNGDRRPGTGETVQFGADGWSPALTNIIERRNKIERENVPVTGGPFTTFDFRAMGGAQVLVSGTGTGEAIITVSGSSASNLETRDEGSTLNLSTSIIDFRGPGVTATTSGNIVRVQVNPVNIETRDEGTILSTATKGYDFTGLGITTTVSGELIRVAVPSLATYDEGTLLDSTTDQLDFRGPGVTATTSGNFVRVQVNAVPLETRNEGSIISIATSSYDFAGPGVNASVSGTIIRVDIPGTPPLETRDENVLLLADTRFIDFAGPGVVALTSGNGIRVQIDATGGGSDLEIFDEGISLDDAVSAIDFTGPGVTATLSGGVVRVQVDAVDTGPTLIVKEDAVEKNTQTGVIEFVGDKTNVTATSSGVVVEVDVPDLSIYNFGLLVSGTTTCMDFAGDGVVVTASGGCVRVDIDPQFELVTYERAASFAVPQGNKVLEDASLGGIGYNGSILGLIVHSEAAVVAGQIIATVKKNNVSLFSTLLDTSDPNFNVTKVAAGAYTVGESDLLSVGLTTASGYLNSASGIADVTANVFILNTEFSDADLLKIDTILAGGVESYAGSVPLNVFQFELDPREYPPSSVFRLRAVAANGTNPLTTHVQLYNLSDGEVVATLDYINTTTLELRSALLTVGSATGNIKLASKIYETRIYVDTPFGPDNSIELGSVEIRVTGSIS